VLRAVYTAECLKKRKLLEQADRKRCQPPPSLQPNLIDWNHHSSGGKTRPYHRQEYYRSPSKPEQRREEEKKYKDILSRAHDLTVDTYQEDDVDGWVGAEETDPDRDPDTDKYPTTDDRDNERAVEGVLASSSSSAPVPPTSPYARYRHAQQLEELERSRGGGGFESPISQDQGGGSMDRGSHTSSPGDIQGPIPVPLLNKPLSVNRPNRSRSGSPPGSGPPHRADPAESPHMQSIKTEKSEMDENGNEFNHVDFKLR
jgi:hypothetical protein